MTAFMRVGKIRFAWRKRKRGNMVNVTKLCLLATAWAGGVFAKALPAEGAGLLASRRPG